MVHRSYEVYPIFLEPLVHCKLHSWSVGIRVSPLPADDFEEVILLISDVVLQLSRPEVANDLVEAPLSQFKRLLHADHMQVNAVGRECLIVSLLEYLLVYVKLGCV